MATRSMGSTDALQIKNSGTDGKFASRNHAMGSWVHTMVNPTLYKMRAFNPSTNQFEFWLASNPSQGPPSGAGVTSKVIAAIHINSFPTT